MVEKSARVIVVLGMHRSGTSVIARGLQVLGVELGNRLMPPAQGNNSKGFWEDVDINALNIEMLHSLKIDWHFLTPIQPADVDTLSRNGYLQRAIELIQQKAAIGNVFGFKDPRVAKLLPFWKKVFTDGNMDVDYILVIRHPRSVYDSLAKRDHLDPEKSYLLWLEHVIGSLMGTAGQKRVLVEYDIFMQEPERELTRIAKELQLSVNATELQYFQLDFLDQNLQHSVYRLDDLLEDPTSPPLLQEVYSSLLDFAKSNLPEDQALTDKIARWENEFSRLRSTLVFIDRLTGRTFALAAARKTLLQEQAQLQQALMAKEQTLQSLRAELRAIHQSWLWRLIKSLKTLLGLFHRTK